MADLTSIQASQAVKLVGANSSGVETNPVNADSNGNVMVVDYASGSASGGTAGAVSLLVGGRFNTVLPTLTNGQQAALQLDASGRIIIRPLASGTDSVSAVQSGTWTVTQSGAWTVAATQSGAWSTGRTWTLASGTDSVSVVQSTNPWIVNVSQFGGNNVVTGTGASGSGVPRVTVSNDSNVLATQSGTWTVQQGTPPWSVAGNVASGVADGGNPVKVGGVFNTSFPILSNGQRGDIQLDSSARQVIAPLTNASVVKSQLQDNAGNGITSTVTSGTKRGIDVNVSDGPQVDSYNRIRIASQDLLFSANFASSLNSLAFNTAAVGSATLTYVANQASARLATTTGATDSMVMQSKRYVRYNPGASHQVAVTGVIGAKKSNVRQRWGYFDANDGLFFEQTSSDIAVVVRTSTSGAPVDTRVTQANWNLDKLDGTGASGMTLDTTKHNAYFIDFAWQGAGRIRFGVFFGQSIVYFHQILGANTNTAPFMRSPSRPIRAELTNLGVTASSTSMDLVCLYAMRETADVPLPPFSSTSSRGTSSVTVSTIKPLISIRPKATFNGITNRVPIVPEAATVIVNQQAILVQVYVNPTLTGASFVSAGTNSAAEIDTSATAVSGGTLIFETYIAASSNGFLDLTELSDNAILGLDIPGSAQDVLCVTATSLAGNTATWAQIAWQEFQ